MGKSILVTGGARSGKSVLAERLTLELGRPAVYIATAEALDEEMEERILAHQSRRGDDWSTVSEPLELADALLSTDGQGPRLVDCLTLWLTNLMMRHIDPFEPTERLIETLPRLGAPVVFVTNEVGAGIVPENKLARDFRDTAGLLNQKVASACDELWLSVAGHPLRLKPE